MNDEIEEIIEKEETLQYQHIVSSFEALDDVNEVKVFQVGKGSSERLIALLVPASDTMAFSLLRRKLRETSPSVPIPEELIIVDSIDKNNTPSELLDIYDKSFKQKSDYVKASNSIEEYLVRLWGEFLPVGRISVEDNFYALGGHSLLLAQMHFAIERDMGVYMDFELMLGTSVLSELALTIAQMKKDAVL
ncbi:phosphopantetheine-binding protein [Bacillus mojavensis]|uniref:phosphopantetheine-binding protein n=1 Tax=Bacillus mojavensis TaxID=72360 RepID=UPI002DB5B29F|nr:phosphopantetheine-binding protein [Bacillus mojavensis]MEC1614774.1 phosphopantetheine-binding protein [Bacillus mojavensis]MEC1690660.1 phosphopantetheine-binding protein [Bacillus mojavensis]